MRIGFLVNPLAGIGGAVALKGSDGEAIVSQALGLGAKSPAPARAELCLSHFFEYLAQQNSAASVQLLTVEGLMGEERIRAFAETLPDLEVRVVYHPDQPLDTVAKDTCEAVREMIRQGVDLILFAGGDGTARNVCAVADQSVPVLGIPSGVKMHSGVFANNPAAAASVLIEMLEGRLVSLVEAEVRDIDEEAFRQGKVRARYFGTLLVPDEVRYVQQVKSGGVEVEALVVEDICADVIEHFDHDVTYFVGSGTTPAEIMEKLGLPNTLLGVDVIKGGKLILADAREDQLFELASRENKVMIIVTVIGGQGHLFGRGNQQLSPRVLKIVGREGIMVIATKTKLEGLDGRPLLLDTGDEALDIKWSGWIPVITGYEDRVLYRLTS